MAVIKELFGDTLVTSSGQTIVSASITEEPCLEGSSAKHVLGLYFAANWCPPCREFTPLLVEFYNRFRKTGSTYCLVDIIFVSSDVDEESYLEYLKKMPWPAMPYNDRPHKVSCYLQQDYLLIIMYLLYPVFVQVVMV